MSQYYENWFQFFLLQFNFGWVKQSSVFSFKQLINLAKQMVLEKNSSSKKVLKFF